MNVVDMRLVGAVCVMTGIVIGVIQIAIAFVIAADNSNGVPDVIKMDVAAVTTKRLVQQTGQRWQNQRERQCKCEGSLPDWSYHA
ncbi:MAG: hypothetical protein SFV19_03925 [Rhodospirillaceae bacterium]|nr:hypothetical protein [Rhodospirillaceae bacterium]